MCVSDFPRNFHECKLKPGGRFVQMKVYFWSFVLYCKVCLNIHTVAPRATKLPMTFLGTLTWGTFVYVNNVLTFFICPCRWHDNFFHPCYLDQRMNSQNCITWLHKCHMTSHTSVTWPHTNVTWPHTSVTWPSLIRGGLLGRKRKFCCYL